MHGLKEDPWHKHESVRHQQQTGFRDHAKYKMNRDPSRNNKYRKCLEGPWEIRKGRNSQQWNDPKGYE